MDRAAEQDLIDRALAGDDGALAALVDDLYPVLTRLAKALVRRPALAEEAVQDALMAMVEHLATFERRSSVKTWTCRILVNGAGKKLAREGRSLPFSALGADDEPPSSPTVDPTSFAGGFWAGPPRWLANDTHPEDLALRSEVRDLLTREIDALPDAQRVVVVMRDVEGWESQDVCNVLDVTEVHQRVLLHRARAKLRAAIEQYLEGGR